MTVSGRTEIPETERKEIGLEEQAKPHQETCLSARSRQMCLLPQTLAFM